MILLTPSQQALRDEIANSSNGLARDNHIFFRPGPNPDGIFFRRRDEGEEQKLDIGV
jgi:hypothetical protein